MADQDDEIIDQNDIDKLLEASSVDNEEGVGDDDIGELSQDDIDALMDGGGPSIDSFPASTEEDNEDDDELDLISQDDINKLVSKKKEQPEPEPQNAPGIQEEPEVQNEPEIQEELVPTEKPDEPAESEAAVHDDGVINESEAVSAEECLVTQENIDQLLSENQADPDEQVFDQEAVPAEENLPEEEPVSNEDIEPEQDVALEETTTEQEVAMVKEKEEDIVENSVPDKTVVNLGEDDDLDEELEKIENDELQGDIDSLLDDTGDSTDEDDWEQDSLISQDDIEELIKSSENEDEDALGDLDGADSSDDDFYDEVGEEDIEEEDGDEEDEDEVEEDSQVILEESEESSEEERKSKPKKKKKGKKKKTSLKIGKKFVVIAASVLLLVSVLSVAGYFFFTKRGNNIQKKKIVAEKAHIEEPIEESEVESVVINVDNNPSKPKVSKPMPDDLIIAPLIMKDFMILAPETIEGLSYIQADITIDYSNDNAYYEIKENMPFYRDVVYLAVQKALGSIKGDKITEPDLLVIVQKALIKALPEGSIKKVSFKLFKAG